MSFLMEHNNNDIYEIELHKIKGKLIKHFKLISQKFNGPSKIITLTEDDFINGVYTSTNKIQRNYNICVLSQNPHNYEDNLYVSTNYSIDNAYKSNILSFYKDVKYITINNFISDLKNAINEANNLHNIELAIKNGQNQEYINECIRKFKNNEINYLYIRFAPTDDKQREELNKNLLIDNKIYVYEPYNSAFMKSLINEMPIFNKDITYSYDFYYYFGYENPLESNFDAIVKMRLYSSVDDNEIPLYTCGNLLYDYETEGIGKELPNDESKYMYLALPYDEKFINIKWDAYYYDNNLKIYNKIDNITDKFDLVNDHFNMFGNDSKNYFYIYKCKTPGKFIGKIQVD